MSATFTTLSSRAVLLPLDDIDTDQIIPAQFLKVVERQGLGRSLFAGWRYRPDGSPDPDFVLNQPQALGAAILVGGRNFGCGSSREHAPWALSGFGFRSVVATSFGDIFRANALKNGLLPVEVSSAFHAHMLDCLQAAPQGEVAIDLRSQSITLPDGESTVFPIQPFSKTCLLNGMDELGYLFSWIEDIYAYEQALESTS